MNDQDPFEEIPAEDFSETNQRYKLVCSPHRSIVCGQCCMDFALLNKLRYDTAYLIAPNEAKRMKRIQRVIQEYYQNPDTIQNPGSLAQAPDLQSRIIAVSSGAYASPGELAVLVSGLCFASRSMPAGRQRLQRLLHASLESMPWMSVVRAAARLEQTKREMKKQDKETRRNSTNDRQSKMEGIQMDLASAVNDMLLLLCKTNVTSYGTFFQEFDSIATAMRDSPSMEAAFAGLNMNESHINFESAGIQSSIEPYMKWMQFVLKHTEGGAPLDDPSEWTRDRLVDFLREHGVSPEPLPSHAVLVKVARQMVRFCMACIDIINSMPDDDVAGALGRESMGIASEEDLAKIAKFNAPATRMGFILDAQVPSGFKLAQSTTDWPTSSPPTEKVFAMARTMHATKFGTLTAPPSSQAHLYNEVLKMMEAAAYTFDEMQKHTGQDYMVTINVGEGTLDHQAMAVRVLGALRLGELETPSGTLLLPLLVVEFLHSRVVKNAAKSTQTFGRGLRQGTLFTEVNATVEETELMLELLRENRRQLSQDDEIYTHFDAKVTKGWKFSILRPCDPEKKGGAKICPPCGKRATKVCGRCKITAYCCEDCQRSHWKTHKEKCKKAK